MGTQYGSLGHGSLNEISVLGMEYNPELLVTEI